MTAENQNVLEKAVQVSGTPNVETSRDDERSDQPKWRKEWPNKLAWFAIWIGCSGALMKFILQVFFEYKEENIVAMTTFVEQSEQPGPVVARVCNNIHLDMEKVLSYNGTDFSFDAYEFLYQAALGKVDFNDTTDALQMHSKRYLLLLSSRVAETFKLDLDRFLLTCFTGFEEGVSIKNCLNEFQWYLEPEIGCYEAKIQLRGYGQSSYLQLDFFLDPSVKMGKYVTQPGVFVTFYHPTDYAGFTDELFLKPNDVYIVSASTEHKTQTQSFKKSKCCESNGPLQYNFTGLHFEVDYNSEYCGGFCLATEYYNSCRCSFYISRNQTNSECLEKRETRACLMDVLYRRNTRIENVAKNCMKGCSRKCEQTSYKLTLLEQLNKVSLHSRKINLEKNIAMHSKETKLAQTLMKKIEVTGNDQLLKNVATVTFFSNKTNQKSFSKQFRRRVFLHFSATSEDWSECGLGLVWSQ